VFVVVLAGLLAGGVHVVSGPDHLAAVAPYAVRRRWRHWVPGALWGAGHVLGVSVIAVLAWAIREMLPLEAITAHSEMLVGVVLIAIGLWTVRTALRTRVHVHTHVHDGERHSHIHVHKHTAHDPHAAQGVAHAATGALGAVADASISTPPMPKHRHSHAPFWVGGLHGLAGSSHLLGVLPALAFPTQTGTVMYLTGYAAGTIGSMVLFSVTLGWATQRLGSQRPGIHSLMTAVAGGIAILVGVFWLLPRG